MADEIRFDDGASYELLMGRWSLLVGERFLDWIGVPGGARWLDVGCGNGAFTEMLVERCAPVAVNGIDPSAMNGDFLTVTFGSLPTGWRPNSTR